MTMEKHHAAWLLVTLLTIGRGAPAHADDARNAAVDKAIDNGVRFLIERTGGNFSRGRSTFGLAALENYALVASGTSLQHPAIRENFALLDKRLSGATATYSVACYIFALDAAISQLETDRLLLDPRKAKRGDVDDPSVGREYRARLSRAVRALVSTQNARGAWWYGASSDFDNSNTQFAVLALGVGAKRGVPIETGVWQGIVRHFVSIQQSKGAPTPHRLTLGSDRAAGDGHTIELVPEDSTAPGAAAGAERGRERKEREAGERDRTTVARIPEDPENPENPIVGTEDVPVHMRGWGYKDGNDATWNMTCAGVSSLVIAREQLRDKLDDDDSKALHRAIRDGFGWIMGNWSPTKSYYGLYSLEKAADLGGVHKFGEHDWYREAVDFLLRRQEQGGGWKGTGEHHEDDRVATALALLVLNRATASSTSTLFTRNPVSRVILTGKYAEEVRGTTDRSWVYLAKLDTHVHFPSLLQTIRKRPYPKLFDFLDDVVASIDPAWKGVMVPELLATYERIEHKKLKRDILEHLERIAGVDYDDPGYYKGWYDRWKSVTNAGEKADAELYDSVVDVYRRAGESAPLKEKAAWALTRLKVRDAIPLFVEDLENDDERIRFAAYNGIRAFFVETPPPFDPAGSVRARRDQITAINVWLRERERDRKSG